MHDLFPNYANTGNETVGKLICIISVMKLLKCHIYTIYLYSLLMFVITLSLTLLFHMLQHFCFILKLINNYNTMSCSITFVVC